MPEDDETVKRSPERQSWLQVNWCNKQHPPSPLCKQEPFSGWPSAMITLSKQSVPTTTQWNVTTCRVSIRSRRFVYWSIESLTPKTFNTKHNAFYFIRTLELHKEFTNDDYGSWFSSNHLSKAWGIWISVFFFKSGSLLSPKITLSWQLVHRAMKSFLFSHLGAAANKSHWSAHWQSAKCGAYLQPCMSFAKS